MIDFQNLTTRVIGMIRDPGATVAEHANPVPPWGVVSREHTVPVIALSSLCATVLWVVFPPAAGSEAATMPLGEALAFLVVRVLFSLVMVFIMAATVAFYSGLVGGSRDFSAAFVLVTLSMTPLFVGDAFLPLPVVGALFALGALFYAFIILYRTAPTVIQIPKEHRGKHFVLVVLTTILAMMLVLIAFAPFATVG